MWKEYQQKTKGKKPSQLLVKAIPFVRGKNALDFGSGALNDAKYLSHKGFNVVALDSEMPEEEVPNVFKLNHSFEKVKLLPKSFNLISSQYSLPFIKPQSFIRVWNILVKSLKQDGIFAGNFFGLHDSWSLNKAMSFHSEEQVKGLFKDFNVLSWKEVKKDGNTAAGEQKHWHVFHIIAIKK